jgi:hypothetical protein
VNRPHIRQRYSGPVRLERIPAIPQKDVRISLDVPAPVMGGVLFVAALPASSAFARAQYGSTLHRRVTERSESSFEKGTTQRAARTTASSSELRANVDACFWMMRFYKRFAVTCRVKANFTIFLRPSDPSSATAPSIREHRDLDRECSRVKGKAAAAA